MSLPPIKPCESSDFIYLFHEYFSFKDIQTTMCVSRQWHRIANDDCIWDNSNLSKVFPQTCFIDEYAWKQIYAGFSFDLEFESPSKKSTNSTVVKILKEFSRLKLESDEGCSVLTLPKGLSLNKLISMAQSTIPSCPIETTWASDYIESYGDAVVDKTYQIVITNSLLKGSSTEEGRQKTLQYLKQGVEIPNGLEGAALFLLAYKCFSKCLLIEFGLGFHPYALCVRSSSDKSLCYVGNFQYDDGMRMHEDGPWYDSPRRSFQILDRVDWDKSVGVIAMKRIPTQSDPTKLTKEGSPKRIRD